jgi:hypothetical protein
MCAEQVLGRQFFFLDVLDNGGALLFVVRTTIDDDTLLGVIAHHVCVFLKQIAHENLDVEHNRLSD